MIEILRFLAGDDHHDDHDDHGHGGDESKLLTIRIIMITFVFLAGACIFLPYVKCMRKNPDEQDTNNITPVCKGRAHQFSYCFAAGMLFSLSLVHILPEAIEQYGTYLKGHAKEEKGHDDHGHGGHDDHAGES